MGDRSQKWSQNDVKAAGMLSRQLQRRHKFPRQKRKRQQACQRILEQSTEGTRKRANRSSFPKFQGTLLGCDVRAPAPLEDFVVALQS